MGVLIEAWKVANAEYDRRYSPLTQAVESDMESKVGKNRNIFLYVTEAQTRWLELAYPEMTEEDLMSVPLGVALRLYEDIFSYGPHYREAVNLMKAIDDFVQESDDPYDSCIKLMEMLKSKAGISYISTFTLGFSSAAILKRLRTPKLSPFPEYVKFSPHDSFHAILEPFTQRFPPITYGDSLFLNGMILAILMHDSTEFLLYDHQKTRVRAAANFYYNGIKQVSVDE